MFFQDVDELLVRIAFMQEYRFAAFCCEFQLPAKCLFLLFMRGEVPEMVETAFAHRQYFRLLQQMAQLVKMFNLHVFGVMRVHAGCGAQLARILACQFQCGLRVWHVAAGEQHARDADFGGAPQHFADEPTGLAEPVLFLLGLGHRADEGAGTLSALDAPRLFQFPIGLNDGRGIHAKLGGQVTDRWKADAGTEFTGGYGHADAVGDLRVEWDRASGVYACEHWPPYCIGVPVQYDSSAAAVKSGLGATRLT